MGDYLVYPWGFVGVFCTCLKAQAGEVESKGNPGLRAGILWWGWHRGLQPRLHPEERGKEGRESPFPSHISHGSKKRPGLPQEKDTYPISIPRNPLLFVSEGGKRTYQRLNLEPKAIPLPERERFCWSPCAKFACPRYAPTIAPLFSGLQVFLVKSQSRGHTSQREHDRTQAVPCQERGCCVPWTGICHEKPILTQL